MLRVKILGADGNYVSRDEIVSLYASDLNYVPYIRKAQIDYDATVNLEVPEGPVMLHAKLKVPGYGYGMWIKADNGGTVTAYTSGAGTVIGVALEGAASGELFEVALRTPITFAS